MPKNLNESKYNWKNLVLLGPFYNFTFIRHIFLGDKMHPWTLLSSIKKWLSNRGILIQKFLTIVWTNLHLTHTVAITKQGRWN